MKNLKITKGEWRAHKTKGSTGFWYINAPFNTMGQLATCYVTNNDHLENTREAEANAQLIADAGTTANKCGKLPSELLAENTQLLEALQVMLRRFENTDLEFVKADYARDLARKAINKTLSR